MNPSPTYQQNRQALNQLMDFITTNAFIELAAPERQQYLQRLKQLIKSALAGEELNTAG
jgi:hypothetical protein